jgi:hypothetical protein
MIKRIIINCFLVSIVAALIAPAFFLIEYIPQEAEEVPQFSKIDMHQTEMSSIKDDGFNPKRHINMRKVSGFERISFLFSQPYMLDNYFKHSRWVFIPFFFHLC